MTPFKVRPIVVALGLFCLSALATLADVPAGWIVAGSSPKDFEFSRDSSAAMDGRYSALIATKPGIAPSGFGTLMQTINAENYRGGRWRLSGYLKTSDATRAQMWMRVDGPDRKVVSFDNMDARPVTGTTGWTRYDIVLDVPSDSVDIAFGFLLTRGGKVWGDNFRLEKVGPTVPVTSAAAAAVLPKEPVNIDFEDSADPRSAGDSGFKADHVAVTDLSRADSPRPHGGRELYIPIDPFGAVTPTRHIDKYNLCGMHVVARARQPDRTALEWDVKLSVIMDGTSRLASIAAGSFTLPSHTKSRVPRRPITALVFRLDGVPESASARISGVPNAANGVIGEFPEAYAERLFDAFDAGTPFILDVTYDSGQHETVSARAPGGISSDAGADKIGFYHGSDSPVRRCLRSLAPASAAGLQQRLVELDHPT